MKPVMHVEELRRFLSEGFPQVMGPESGFSVEAIGEGFVTMKLVAAERHLRPGGTVSGPTLFTLADVSAYVAILAHIGPVALAVTTNMSINFLIKPPPGTLEARASILKLGKRLAVVEVAISGEDDGTTVCHAVATYSIPPTREAKDGAGNIAVK
ncbi:PaaI family thioesterase [Jiella endophytica]|uniref:PaaI family thioesterase n=1 Tax=Jiella endophytica TaxID=2558362 RepID=A0A4Y8RG86_9HYPH|nr:PaaI family thioesterase [Jiella endophytica]TFF20723.1 PaaI family thioesterase [Jiella endophytica]TFF27024.1 PaaI family thioesterase [Jiella endophytica]